jgi:hypothetical protein
MAMQRRCKHAFPTIERLCFSAWSMQTGYKEESGQKWPQNSPDLNPCHYFLWGFFKEKIFPKKLQTIMESRALIILACNTITEDMWRQGINNITVHVEEVARCNCGHTEHLIHRG